MRTACTQALGWERTRKGQKIAQGLRCYESMKAEKLWRSLGRAPAEVLAADGGGLQNCDWT